MYILGFALIFAGLSLFLYFFVQRFAGRPGKSYEMPPAAQPEADTIPFSPSNEIPPPPVTTPLSEYHTIEEAPGSASSTTTGAGGSEETTQTSIPKGANALVKEPDLFITGYLYVDEKRLTVPYLDHPDRSPPESMAGLNRLGSSTLRSWNRAFQFDHGAGLIVLPENRLKEIRFSPGGAVFVPSVPELPILYFFTVEARAIREFLSQRSR